MPFNLAEAIKGLISDDLVSKASTSLGETESNTRTAFSGILPIIAAGLTDKAATIKGADTVANLATEQHNNGVLENAANFFEGNNQSSVQEGSMLTHSVFGENVNKLTSNLSAFSGLKATSISSLLSIVTPMVLAFLGKNISTNHLNATGLASMLSSQKNNITNALPANLNLTGILGNTIAPAAQTVAHTTLEQENNIEEKSKGMKLLLPLLLLVLVAAAAWYFMGNHTASTDNNVSTVTDTATLNSAVASISHVDTSGNYIYDLGKMITIDLPNNAGKLIVGENSTENKLYQFLVDTTAKIDTVKGNWFEFTNVRFKTGGSEIHESSIGQLKNIVAITKGFPNATFKLGGYTDNTGDSVINISISQKRAESVETTLKKLGTTASAIIAVKGYGSAYPIGDNATTEGKAMNRRVALNVKSK